MPPALHVGGLGGSQVKRPFLGGAGCAVNMTERSGRLRLAWSLPAGTGPPAPRSKQACPRVRIPRPGEAGRSPGRRADMPAWDPAPAQGSSPKAETQTQRRLRRRARPRRGCAVSVQNSEFYAGKPLIATDTCSGFDSSVAGRAIKSGTTVRQGSNRVPLAGNAIRVRFRPARVKRTTLIDDSPPAIGSRRRRRIHHNHRRHRRARHINGPRVRVARRRRRVTHARPAPGRANLLRRSTHTTKNIATKHCHHCEKFISFHGNLPF